MAHAKNEIERKNVVDSKLTRFPAENHPEPSRTEGLMCLFSVGSILEILRDIVFFDGSLLTMVVFSERRMPLLAFFEMHL